MISFKNCKISLIEANICVPIGDRTEVFHTLVYVSYLSYQHDSIDHATNGMEEHLHSPCFVLDNLDMTSNECN